MIKNGYIIELDGRNWQYCFHPQMQSDFWYLYNRKPELINTVFEDFSTTHGYGFVRTRHVQDQGKSGCLSIGYTLDGLPIGALVWI